mgnify:CR=1 FL=1
MKRFFGLGLLLASLGVEAAQMTELRYQDQDAGGEPYATRFLMTDRYLRMDSGGDNDDFVLFDRKTRQAVNVLHGQRILMYMRNKPLPSTRPFEYKVEEIVTPVNKSTVRVLIRAANNTCSESVAAKGLLPDAVRALTEFKAALAYTQWQTYSGTPEDLRQVCDLVHHVWESGRALSYGLPIEERDYSGKVRMFSGHQARRLKPALFRLPKGYVEMQPPENEQSGSGQAGSNAQPASVQAR